MDMDGTVIWREQLELPEIISLGGDSPRTVLANSTSVVVSLGETMVILSGDIYLAGSKIGQTHLRYIVHSDHEVSRFPLKATPDVALRVASRAGVKLSKN